MIDFYTIMALFLFFYAPCFFLFLLALENRSRYAWYKQYEWKKTGLSFGKGCLVFLVVALVHLLFKTFFVPVYLPLGFFYLNFFINHLLNWGVLLGGYVLFQGLADIKQGKGKGNLENFIAYVTGFYFLNSVMLIFMQTGDYPFIYVFFLPLMNWAIMIYMALMLERAWEEYGFLRGVFIAGCFFFPFVAASILYLYVINYFLPALALGITYFVGSFFLYRYMKSN